MVTSGNKKHQQSRKVKIGIWTKIFTMGKFFIDKFIFLIYSYTRNNKLDRGVSRSVKGLLKGGFLLYGKTLSPHPSYFPLFLL